MPKVDTTLALLSGAKVFSKRDANSGFWQIPLADKSKLLITFITPYGRFCFNKLPFGISSAPEIFQCLMSEVLSGLLGGRVLWHVDDVLGFGKDRIEHDTRLQARPLSRDYKLQGLHLTKVNASFTNHVLPS